MLRGAAVLAVAQIASRAIGLAFTLTLAHLVLIEDFGAYNLALSALVVAAILQDAGLSRTVVKEVARAPQAAAEWVGGLALLKLGLSLLVAPLLPLAAWLAGFAPATVVIAAIVAGTLPALNIWLLLENAAQGVNAITTLALAALVVAALQAGCGIAAALATGGNMVAIAVSYIAASVLSAGFLWRRVSRVTGQRLVPRVDPAFWRETLVASLPYLGVALAVAALGRVETLLLGAIAGEAEVARFVAAFKLFEAGLFLIYAIQIAMNPILARFVVEDRAALGRWFAWETSLAAALLLPAALVAVVVSAPLVALIYPESFAPAAAPMMVLLGALPLAALQVLASGILMLTDRQRQVLAVNAVLVGVQVLLNLVLAPWLGALGSALAVAGLQAVAAATMIGLVAAWLLEDWRRVLRPLAGVLAAQAVACLAGVALWPLAGPVPALVAGAAVFLVGLRLARLRLLPPA